MSSSRKEDSGSASQTRGAHGSAKRKRFPIHITTFNMGRPSNSKEPIDQRRELILTTLKTLRPSLLFCQELPALFEKKVIDSTSKDYRFQKNREEAGVVWHKEYFEECGDSPKTTDTEIQKIRDRLQKSGKEVSELLSRVAMVKLKDKQYGKEVLALSWHGRWTGGTDEKKEAGFWGLVHCCQTVAKYVGNIPFIIGGDFNFDTSTLDESLLSKEGITCSTYELSGRAQEAASKPNRAATPYKDTFVFSRGIVLKDVKSFKFSTTSGRRPEKADPVKLLDHDPISAVLSFEGVHIPGAPRGEDLPDLRTRFDSMSLQSTVASGRQDSRGSRRHFREGLGDGAGWEG